MTRDVSPAGLVRAKLATAAVLRKQARADEARADQLEAEALALSIEEAEHGHVG